MRPWCKLCTVNFISERLIHFKHLRLFRPRFAPYGLNQAFAVNLARPRPDPGRVDGARAPLRWRSRCITNMPHSVRFFTVVSLVRCSLWSFFQTFGLPSQTSARKLLRFKYGWWRVRAATRVPSTTPQTWVRAHRRAAA